MIAESNLNRAHRPLLQFMDESRQIHCQNGLALLILTRVKGTAGTLQQGGASFATTHWSVVAQSALTNGAEAENALAELCKTYWPPIYSFIRRRGYSPADAQDLTQSFFAFFLRTKGYARADQLNGKFRSFLLASVKNFLADNWDRERAVKRGGKVQFVLLDQQTAESFYDAASSSDSNPESLFDARWAQILTSSALNSLRRELDAEGKIKIFEQLKSFLTGGSVLLSYDEASTRTGLPAATVKTHVHRLRLRYREIVRREVARTVSGPHQIEEELRYLYTVLAKAA